MKLQASVNGALYSIETQQRPNVDEAPLFEVSISGQGPPRRVRVLSRTRHRWTLLIDNRVEDCLIYDDAGKTWVDWRGQVYPVEITDPRQDSLHSALASRRGGSGSLKAQMPGKVVKVLIGQGDTVESGQGLVIVEAMKMQNELKAPTSGIVKTCRVVEGQNVNGGDLLFEIE